ncbi:MAG: T9SS type A sorting domain-containing protein [Bacteroidota bacterium]
MRFISCFLILLFVQCNFLLATTYYVAKSGDDNNAGTLAAPFLTIQQAANTMMPGDSCIIGEGRYAERITPGNNNLVFKAAQDARVEITGYDQVDTWTQQPNSNIYEAQLSWNLGDQNQVLFDGKMMNLARWPNKTNFDPFDLEAIKITGTNTTLSHSDIPDIPWQMGGVVYFIGKSRWTSWRKKITAASAGQISYPTLSNDWQYGGSHSPTNGGEFFLMNSLDALDAPGEWFLESFSKKLYFWAPDDVDPSTLGVLVRRRTQAFNLTNKSQIVLDSLVITGANIRMKGAQGCVVRNCEILYGNHTIASTSAAFVGDASIELDDNATGNLIEHNNIQWGAANGIVLKGSNNVVDNNFIGHFNYLGSYAAPVELRGNNDLRRNEIFSAGRDGIRGGGSGSDCGYNDIHHTNLINDDCGGIYFCCGQYNNTRIHHNWIHDIASRNEHFDSYKGTGIYLDNSTEDVIVDHNVLWNLEWSCIQINWAGKNLLMYNNTLWSNDGPRSASMGRWVNGYTFTNVQLYNTLSNEPTFHASDEQNSIALSLNANPFEDMAASNYMPKANSSAIDAGRVIAGYTDGYVGASPDVGAYEQGGEAWVAGPDWELSTPTTSVEEASNQLAVKVYPNPSNVGYLNIEAYAQGPLQISLFDLQGSLLRTVQSQSPIAKIDTSALASGIYILEIVGRTGRHTQKIVLQ